MMGRTSRVFSILAAVLASGWALQAQDPSDGMEVLDLLELLNTPVVGASKREQRLIDSPQAIEVLTSEDIRQMGIYRIQDALKLMTSVDLMEGDNGYSVVGMRGVMQEGQPRTVQILIDGVPLYVASGAAVDINNIPLPIDVVERIEVVRGPSSTLYGANAVVGVIAITTKKLDKGIHGDLRASRADKGTSRGNANIRWSQDGFGVMAGYGGASLGNSGYRTHRMGTTQPYLDAGSGKTVDPWIVFDGAQLPYHQADASHQNAAFAKGEYRSERTHLWLSVGQSHKMISPVGQAPISYMNYRFYDISTFLAGWNQSWTKSFSTEVRLHQMRNKISAGPAPILAVVLADPAWNADYTWGDFTSSQIDLQANWNPSESLHFVMGLDTRSMEFGKDVMHGILEKTKESASGGFLSMDWNAASNQTLSLGLRAENESLGGSRISPRAIYVINPSKNSVLRVAFLTSTRSPQYFEQRIDFKVKAPLPAPYTPAQYPIIYRILPNPELKPEKTTNFEIGYRHQIGLMTLDATLYQMKFSNLINQLTVGVQSLAPLPLTRVDTQFKNSGDATNTGLELAATFSIKKGWTSGINFSYVDFKKDNAPAVSATNPLGDQFAYTVKTKANAWTRLQVDKFTGYLALQYLGATDVQALQVYGAPLFDKRDSIFQYHVNLGYEFLKGLSFNAYVRNGAKEFTEQGISGPDRPIYYLAARREIGGTLAYRF